MDANWMHIGRARLWVALLLPALVCRILVPQGFMPGTGADNAPTMQMCHGAGALPASTHPTPGGKGPAPERGRHHGAPCVFAAAGSSAPPPAATLVPDSLTTPDVDPSMPDLVCVERAFHRAQAARAPPAGQFRA
jgi:hypothetical protein